MQTLPYLVEVERLFSKDLDSSATIANIKKKKAMTKT